MLVAYRLWLHGKIKDPKTDYYDKPEGTKIVLRAFLMQLEEDLQRRGDNP